MKRRCLAGAVMGAVLLLVGGTQAEEWRSLFDGKSLEGWEKHGGAAEYAVEDGAIVGHSVPNTRNSFLCTKERFQDFELTFEVKVDDALNSGVQVRSNIQGDDVVFGPQVEIAAGPGSAGFIYGESTGRGWISPDVKSLDVFKNGQWNAYRVVCQGASIKTWINGQPVADLTDADSNHDGVIGLQVHGVGNKTEPLFVRWRNLRIRPIQ